MDNVNKAARIIYLSLIAYICPIPFYYYPPSFFSGFKIPFIKYFPLLFIAALFSLSAGKGSFNLKMIREDKLNSAVLVYFFLTLLSGIGTAYYPVSAFKAIYYAATGILVYFIIRSWSLSQGGKVSFLRPIVFIGSIASLYGIITLFLGRDLFFGNLQYSESNLVEPGIWLKMGRISSSLGNPLFLGGVLSLLFPVSVYLYLLDRKPGQFSLTPGLCQAVIIFLGLLLTFSIGAFVGVIFFYIYYLLKIKGPSKGRSGSKGANLLLLLGAGLCFLLLSALAANIFSLTRGGNYVFGEFLGKVDFRKITNIQAVSLRWDSLKYTAAFLRTPGVFSGIGIGRIGTGEYLPRVSLDNYLCLSLMESGVFATGALLLVFWITIRRKPGNGENRIGRLSIFPENPRALGPGQGLYLYLRASIIIFFINLLFFDALNQPVMRILLWSFIGFIV